jgi:hypothetical protein
MRDRTVYAVGSRTFWTFVLNLRRSSRSMVQSSLSTASLFRSRAMAYAGVPSVRCATGAANIVDGVLSLG